MSRQGKIIRDLADIETANRYLREQINHERQKLKEYQEGEKQFLDKIKSAEDEIDQNNKKYFALGAELRKLSK